MHAALERHQPWLVYPATLLLAFALHAALLATGASLTLSANITVFAAAAWITWLEWRFPHKPDWLPARREVGQDLLFMVTVQMVLPRLLGLLVVLAAADAIGPAAPLSAYWPHHIPLAAQAVLMVLAADFLRYWLHRISHQHPLLWRLHAVHHSPERLYWLNVGRFHPFDKFLQFLLDSLPFVLLGVAPEVIALYFVFYAVNGFFQHSNIRLRFGPLNYLISSAELHRWHHSKLPEESNRNYGNNLILWDLLFGTWFLPDKRQVGVLGLRNRAYPHGFVEQMIAPFTPNLADREVPMQGWRMLARRTLLWLRMQWIGLHRWLPMRVATFLPAWVQARTLKRILKRSDDTRFGRTYGFTRIANHLEFVRRVPLHDYEALRPYIQAQEAGEVGALTHDPPFMYAVTSGTTGTPKYLPVSKYTLRQYKAGQQLFSYWLYRFCPTAFHGRIFGIASPAVEGFRSSGLPFGSVSGHLYASMPRLMQRNYVLPPAVSEIEDYNVKYLVMLYLALLAEDVTYVAAANPSSFLRLLTVLNEARARLADSLEQGSLAPLGAVPDSIHARLLEQLRPAPERAAWLRGFASDQTLSFADLWPDLRLLTVWTGGSCAVALEALRGTLPSGTRVVELGYLSSEMRATVTVDADTGAGLPMLQQHFFEFIERADFEAERPYIRLLHELLPGHEYYVIVTTASGLYRYWMNDVVRVVGRCGFTPTLRFVQKGRGVTSITGEKLYEHQLLQAVADAAAEFGFITVFVLALADSARSRYRLFIEPQSHFSVELETLAAWIDARLGALNLEYQGKRASGRLDVLEVQVLADGTGDAYRKYCVGQGQREGQFKIVALQSSENFDFPLQNYVFRHI